MSSMPSLEQTSGLVPRKKNRTGQFIVSLGERPVYAEAKSFELGGVCLTTFPGLDVRNVMDESGRQLGWMLGDVVDYRRESMLTGDVALPVRDAAVGPDDEEIEKHIYSYGGRFCFILALPSMRRIYLDADGALSVVYDPSMRRAASTAGLLLDDDEYARRFDRELYEHLRVHDDGWFPAGLTSHQGVSRLFCNHYLDLDDWRTVRHWPTGDIEVTTDPLENVVRIAEITRKSIVAMMNSGATTVALTAGNETRFLLASVRDIAREINFVTVNTPSTRLDVVRAQDLARKFDLKHRLLPLVRATGEQDLSYRYGSGHCIGGSNVHSHPSIEPLSQYRYFAGGLGGEIGRAFFWRTTDDMTTEVTAKSLLSRFGMPPHRKTLEAVERWLPSVSRFNSLLKIDLAYLELRMSCWAFSQAYANPVVKEMHPLIGRESFTLMLQLPPSWKRENKLCTEGVRALWPDLLSFPVNRYGDYRDHLAPLRKAARNPYLIVKKLRKLYGA